MPKISTSNANSIIIKYIVKIVVSTVLSVFLLSSLFSFIILKLDLDLKLCEYFSVAVCIISGFVISYISTGGFKNNLLLLSIISVFPLLIFVIINYCINSGNIAVIAIKILSILITSFMAAIIKSKRKTR